MLIPADGQRAARELILTIAPPFLRISHIETIRRISGIELIAVSSHDFEKAKEVAKKYFIPKCYETAEELISDPEIQVVHNCTPNHLHLEINARIISTGKHVFSEKPLGMTFAESKQMLTLLAQHPKVVAGVNFCYRMNALVQDARNRIASGEIGKVYLIHGSYLQDWLLYDTDYNWRIDPRYSGESRCVADIGSHWMDTAQVLAGCRITAVCANLATMLPVRKKPTHAVKTFAVNDDVQREEVRVDTEDYAGVLVRFENGAAGVFQCSQVSAGRKNYLDIEVDGSISSFHWQQESSDYMWKGNRDKNNEEVMRNPVLLTPNARRYAHLPAGQPEGWNDAFCNTLVAYYDFIRSGKQQHGEKCDFATFEDGHYIAKLTEAILRSAREKRWINVD